MNTPQTRLAWADTQLERRIEYARTHDIYGNDEAQMAEVIQMWDEAEERRRQTMQAFRDRIKAQGGELWPWHRPMGIDEQFVPGTKLMFDYGRLYEPESVKITHRLDTQI